MNSPASKTKKTPGQWKRRLLLLGLLACFAASCTSVKPRPAAWLPANALRAAAAPELGDDQDALSLLQALDRTVEKLDRLNPGDIHHFGPVRTTNAGMRRSLDDFRSRLRQMGLTGPFFDYVRSEYLFFRSAAPRVLFTGYYEPLLRGSLQPHPGFPFPLYRRPDDLVFIDLKQFQLFQEHPDLPEQIRGRLRDDRHVVPYFSRQEIEEGSRLAGKDLEIVWTDDAIDVFFLQIQGSGIVALPDGERLRVGYADQNGHPYRSIGKLLLETGALEKGALSMQGIKRYLRQHPEKMAEIMNYNPSYIFFRFLDNGPVGSLGVSLTPWRSIATDRRLYPQGALVFIETTKPVLDGKGGILRWEKFARFVLNQDTGGAIRGPDRVDLFCGSGPESELTAGSMRQEGMFHFLLKKDQVEAMEDSRQ